MRELNYIDETIEKNENPALRIGSVGRSALSTVYLMDCIEGMKQFPDKIFDLAVVDPPYGINAEQGTNLQTRTKFSHKEYGWDSKPPSEEYFEELERVSKNQIIWGANHFRFLPTPNFIVWDKGITCRGRAFSDCELAWGSKGIKGFGVSGGRMFDGKQGMVANNGHMGAERIHPTQKPIDLYDWIFAKYASGGNLILDTHLGSQSSRIAANKAGLDFIGFEIDREYFDNGNTRFKNFVSQGVLF